MKYDLAEPYKCYMTQSKWYRNAQPIEIRGVLWHSTGCNNPNISRYVQPDDTSSNKISMLNYIGNNVYHNDWNHTDVSAGVHAFIGKVASGEVTTVNVGPWEKQAWGCGNGKYGSCNDGWIQFEICEDDLCDKTYFDKVYAEACELTAFLCKRYFINPQGTVTYRSMQVPTILCHADSNRLGLGSNHGDVLHWFSRYGKSMDDVRHDVTVLLQEDDMTQEQFNTMMNEYRRSLQDNDAAAWSKADREWAVKSGLISGTPDINGNINYMWQDFLTREQAAALFHRFSNEVTK